MKWYGIGAIYSGKGSHPARGAWIEITIADNEPYMDEVAPRKGCVD